MIKFDEAFEAECAEYLAYLYDLAARKYGDHGEIDNLVQDTMTAFLMKCSKGEAIDHPKGFLAAVLHNKHNQFLRQKYRNHISLYDCEDYIADEDEMTAREEAATLSGEYEAVRREIGRLIGIYREVTVRYYVHGQSVDVIANALGIPKGTVLSRLSTARGQIKEGITKTKMEKYSQISYEPKWVSLGIWGGDGLNGEPFSLVCSPIEANILVIAYDKPVSVREIADAMGMPAAYIEPAIDKLVQGELMGKTAGGLVYTRCFMTRYDDAFGNIPAQEALAHRMAEQVWSVAWKHMEPLTKRPAFAKMSNKQKATMLLFFMNQSLWAVVNECKPHSASDPKHPPDRPNAGRWLATATVFDYNQPRNSRYDASGPMHLGYFADDGDECWMDDFQSVFGDAHWAYGTLKYNCHYSSILRFYASFTPAKIKTDNQLLYELIPEFEKLHIIRRDEQGEVQLDIPTMPYEEDEQYWKPVIGKIKDELMSILGKELTELWQSTVNRVPKHVDEWQYYVHAGALNAYAIAQMLAVVEQGLMPYEIEVGKCPLIYLVYRERERQVTVAPKSFDELMQIKDHLREGKTVLLNLAEFGDAIWEYLQSETILTSENHRHIQKADNLIMPIEQEPSAIGFAGIEVLHPMQMEDFRKIVPFLLEHKVVILDFENLNELVIDYIRSESITCATDTVQKINENTLVITPGDSR